MRELGHPTLTEELNELADGPSITARRFKALDSNGFRFRIVDVDDRRATQNSGIGCQFVDSGYYYGQLKDIIEVVYSHGLKYILLKCDWVDPIRGTKVDQFQFTLVNFNNLLYRNEQVRNEPFILASQAEQVFYVSSPSDPNWKVAVKMSRRGVFVVEQDEPDTIGFVAQQLDQQTVVQREEDIQWVRETVEGEMIDFHVP